MKRFFDKIDKTENCWNWTAATRKTGYGCMKFRNKLIDAHRISWIIHYGEIPKNLCVCHKCDNRKCVNPNHLFLGTQSDNMKDAFVKGRIILPVNGSFKKGHYPKNTLIPLELAILVKKAILNRNKEKLKNISLRFNVPYQFVRDISCGRILKMR
jgi:hypothetical protein